MTTFNPFKDFALWCGSFAPEGFQQSFELGGFALQFILAFMVFGALAGYLESRH